MRISQLAARSGVPATTLRFYEDAGLRPAERTPAGYRVYGENAVQRLAFIGAAKHLGLPLEEISELLTVWEAAACRGRQGGSAAPDRRANRGRRTPGGGAGGVHRVAPPRTGAPGHLARPRRPVRSRVPLPHPFTVHRRGPVGGCAPHLVRSLG
ncbi:MerR family transcriptional regulator [Streptomyces cyaneofuscatus]